MALGNDNDKNAEFALIATAASQLVKDNATRSNSWWGRVASFAFDFVGFFLAATLIDKTTEAFGRKRREKEAADLDAEAEVGTLGRDGLPTSDQTNEREPAVCGRHVKRLQNT